MKTAIIFLGLVLFSLGLAKTGAGAEQQEEPGGSDREFRGWLLITSDRDWKEKWDTPSEVIPRFVEAKSVRLGENITILTFYLNPGADEDNHISITCDIKIIRPDERISYEQEELLCGDGEIVGDPQNIRLAYVVIDFSAELGDPYGIWTVEVLLRDHNGLAEVFLQDHFALVDQSTLTHMRLNQVQLADVHLK
ncbi:hypothetical protein [Desulfopila inferna]|uniref:hypothetical protein n=1 Tax=Desulfopila inferna TaxID=468528 RepID=UPI0019637C00|nr:hypothetical protein [Desulfopila inferna]MBM9604872.1 hypothetical protein [Desulfopila inferna]